MKRTTHFIEPLDVLFLRGNKLFGEPGSYGESPMPPWPSVAAGALRSALLAHRRIDLSRFAKGEVEDDELGTPRRPGSFTVAAFHLARRRHGAIEPLLPLPADLVVVEKQDNQGLGVRRITPYSHRFDLGIRHSAATDELAVLPEPRRDKSKGGCWITGEGWRRYLRGKLPDPAAHLVTAGELWKIDARIGVGLDATRRAAAEGKLFSSEGIVLGKMEHCTDRQAGSDIGFLVETEGATLPDALTLRFGGDGRGALSTRVDVELPMPDYEAIANARRCRMILVAPGLFPDGWRPTGIADGSRFNLHGVAAQLRCAAVPRAEVVSGFDIANERPKPAQRAAPSGSVYWLDDLDATPDALRNLARRGLWSDPVEDAARRAEGFNRIALAAY